jgi:carbon monoxide dehydrogenase subunit G
MKVRLDKRFPMPAPADTAWALLQDIEAVAGCMPGARITERIDAQHYKGTVAIKLGPANLNFRGEIEVKALDAAARSLQLAAKGTDATGGSAASMDLTARVEAVDAAGCALVGTSEVSMSGKVAAFGSRMMGPVSEQVLAQFAANFAARLQALRAAEAPAAAAPAAPGAPAAAAAADQTSQTAIPPTAPLNGLALLWAVVKGWLHGLFSARKA